MQERGKTDDSEKPPSSLDTSSRILLAPSSLARRLKNIGAILTGDWSVCPIRNPVSGRFPIVLENFWEVER